MASAFNVQFFLMQLLNFLMFINEDVFKVLIQEMRDWSLGGGQR